MTLARRRARETPARARPSPPTRNSSSAREPGRLGHSPDSTFHRGIPQAASARPAERFCSKPAGSVDQRPPPPPSLSEFFAKAVHPRVSLTLSGLSARVRARMPEDKGPMRCGVFGIFKDGVARPRSIRAHPAMIFLAMIARSSCSGPPRSRCGPYRHEVTNADPPRLRIKYFSTSSVSRAVADPGAKGGRQGSVDLPVECGTRRPEMQFIRKFIKTTRRDAMNCLIAALIAVAAITAMQGLGASSATPSPTFERDGRRRVLSSLSRT